MSVRIMLLAACALSGHSCSKEAKVQACVVHADCDVGDACVGETCSSIECFGSAECDRGLYCSPDYQCVSGCEADLDCPTGEQCEDGTCAPFTCRDTQLDCDYDQVCGDDACEPHGGNACSRCDPGIEDYCFPLYESTSCDEDTDCLTGERCYVADYIGDEVCSSDDECDPGYACKTINFSDGTTSGPHCTRNACFAGAIYPPCVPSEPNSCGRGFQCYDLGGDLGVCFGDCEWLVDNGHIPSE